MVTVLLRATRILVPVLCVTCVVELVVFFAARERTGVYRQGQSFPIPSGYQVNARYMRAASASCYLVRVTADACPFCRRDREQYQQLAERARGTGCQILDVAPEAGAIALRDDDRTVQLQYVDLQFGTALNPFLTPQTILLDRDGRMVWQQQGPLKNPDLDAALERLNEWH